MNSVAQMDDVYSSHGNVIMKMIVKMDLTKKIANILLVLQANLLVITIVVFQWHKLVLDFPIIYYIQNYLYFK